MRAIQAHPITHPLGETNTQLKEETNNRVNTHHSDFTPYIPREVLNDRTTH
jgi:hypothetical protein